MNDGAGQGLTVVVCLAIPVRGLCPPIVTDAAINIVSSLEHKRDIDKTRNWARVNDG